MGLTAKQIEEKFIAEINEIGVKNIAYMDIGDGRYQALELRMADGNLRWWKLKSGDENEFENKLKFVGE